MFILKHLKNNNMLEDKFLPGVIKGIGGLASYFLSAASVRQQNRYNSPKEQVRRLREAGIPLAAAKYFESNQTNLPDTSGVSNAAHGLSEYINTQNQMEAGRISKYTADVLEQERNAKVEIMPEMDGKTIDNYTPVSGDSALQQNLRREWALKATELSTAETIKALKDIELTNAPEKIRSDIDSVLQETANKLQINTKTQQWLDFQKLVHDDIMKGGTGWDGIQRLIKAMFYKIIIGQ